MEFTKKGLLGNKYLADGCEFKKINNEYQLFSTKNNKYSPFIGETWRPEAWEGISRADVTFGEKHERLYNLLLDHFRLGNTIFDHNANILLKKDERIVFRSFNNIILKEPSSVRISNTSHEGIGQFNGRFFNGYGVSKSVTKIQEVIKPVDVGQFIITNKRFIFSGNKRNIDVNISQITAVTPYADGFKLQRKSKQKPEYFINVNLFSFMYEFEGENYFYRMKGDIVGSLIEGGLNKTPQKSKLDELEAKQNEDTNFCSNCGSGVNSDDKFCRNCGFKL